MNDTDLSSLKIAGTLDKAQRMPLQAGVERYLVVISGSYYYLGRGLFEALGATLVAGGQQDCLNDALVTDAGDNTPTAALSFSPGDMTGRAVEKLIAAGILIGKGAAITARKRRRKKFHVDLTLVSEEGVSLLSRPLTVFFRLPLAIVAGLASLLVLGWFIAQNPAIATRPFRILSELNAHLSAGLVLTAVGLVLVSSLFHELGHASAMYHYGLRAGRIGFAIYVIFPVFYTELSEAWRLPGKQRAVVALGGFFMQAIFVAALDVYSFLYPQTLHIPIEILNVSFLLSTLGNLNPFLKFDGYWFLADIFNKPRLSEDSVAMLSSVMKAVRGGSEARAALRQRISKTDLFERSYFLLQPLINGAYFSYLFFIYAGMLGATAISLLALVAEIRHGAPDGYMVFLKAAYSVLIVVAIVTSVLSTVWSCFARKQADG